MTILHNLSCLSCFYVQLSLHWTCILNILYKFQLTITQWCLLPQYSTRFDCSRKETQNVFANNWWFTSTLYSMKEYLCMINTIHVTCKRFGFHIECGQRRGREVTSSLHEVDQKTPCLDMRICELPSSPVVTARLVACVGSQNVTDVLLTFSFNAAGWRCWGVHPTISVVCTHRQNMMWTQSSNSQPYSKQCLVMWS